MPNYFNFITYANDEYCWKEGIEEVLENEAGLFIEGEKAISIHNATMQLLSLFNILNTVSEGVLMKQHLTLSRAMPLIKTTPNMTLEPDNNAIQTVADKLNSDNLTEDEKKILDYLMEVYNEKEEEAK